jgi:hypothetical protein
MFVARCSRFIERSQRFAQGAQFHRNAANAARITLGNQPSQGCDKTAFQRGAGIAANRLHATLWRTTRFAH